MKILKPSASQSAGAADAAPETPMNELERKLAARREKIRKAEEAQKKEDESGSDENNGNNEEKDNDNGQRARSWTADAREAEAERMRDWEAAARSTAGAEYGDDESDESDKEQQQREEEEEEEGEGEGEREEEKLDDLYKKDENITGLDAVATDAKRSKKDFAAGVAAAEVHRIHEKRERVGWNIIAFAPFS